MGSVTNNWVFNKVYIDVINAQDEVLISLQKILVEEPWKVILC